MMVGTGAESQASSSEALEFDLTFPGRKFLSLPRLALSCIIKAADSEFLSPLCLSPSPERQEKGWLPELGPGHD